MPITCVVSVNALITYDNWILLTQEKKEHVYGKRWLPWWKMETWESFDEAIQREIYEETGMLSSFYRLEKLAVFQQSPEVAVKHLYHAPLFEFCDVFHYNPDELLDVQRWDMNNLPPVEAFRRPRFHNIIVDFKAGIFNNGIKLYE